MTVTLLLNGFDKPRIGEIIIVYGELKSENTYYVREMIYTLSSLEEVLNDEMRAKFVAFENTLYREDYKIVGRVLDAELIINPHIVRSSVKEAYRKGDMGLIRIKTPSMVTITLEDYRIESVNTESKNEQDDEKEVIKIPKVSEERDDELEETKPKKWRGVFDKYR